MTASNRHLGRPSREWIMLPSVNRVTLVGVVGRDPEMRFTPSGDAVAAFRLAVNRAWGPSRAGRGNSVDWFNIIAWHQLAETSCQSLRKGSAVYVEGRLQQRTWVDDSGATQQRIEVVATEITPLGEAPWRLSPRAGRPSESMNRDTR